MTNNHTCKLRFAVCGTAHWAEKVHIPGIQRHPQTELIGVWGRNDERVGVLAGQFDIRGFTDFDEMLAEVDAVAFALPPIVQGKLALRAAQAGKALLVEKPPSTSLPDALALREEVERRGLRAACFLTRRHIPQLADLVAQGKELRATSGLAKLHAAPLVAGSPYAASVWRGEADGALWDLGPHTLTMLIDVLGPVEAVSAEQQGNALIAKLHHRAGRTSVMDINIRAEPRTSGEIYGFSRDSDTIRVERGDYDRLAAFDGALNEIVAPVSRETASAASLSDAVGMVKVLDAIARSISTRGAVEV